MTEKRKRISTPIWVSYYSSVYSGLFYKDREKLLRLGWIPLNQMCEKVYFSKKQLSRFLKSHRDYLYRKGLVKIVHSPKGHPYYFYLWAPEAERFILFVRGKRNSEKQFEERIKELVVYYKDRADEFKNFFGDENVNLRKEAEYQAYLIKRLGLK